MRVRGVERVVALVRLRPVAKPGPGRVPIHRRAVRAEELRHPVDQVARLRAERRPSDPAANEVLDDYYECSLPTNSSNESP